MSRRWNAARYVSIMFVSLTPAHAFAQVTASFLGVGDLPGGEFSSNAIAVSADGRVVVGWSKSAVDKEAFRWENGVLTSLAHLPLAHIESEAHAVSADGRVIVGMAAVSLYPLGTGPRAVRWEGGMVEMDQQGYTVPQDAFGVSADGNVVIGMQQHGVGSFVWRNGELLTPDQLPGGATLKTIYAVSPEGTSFAGYCNDTAHSCKWAGGELTMLSNLPSNPLGDVWPTAILHDGNTIVGYGASHSGHEAVVWRDGKTIGLGDLPGGNFYSIARGASADGLVVVGGGTDETGTVAFVWDIVHGLRTVQAALTSDFGLDLSGWRLLEATGVSADGLTIVGNGINPEGFREGWVARVTTPPTILRSDPPNGFFDAREDVSPTTLEPTGVDRIRVVFSKGITNLDANGPPAISSFELSDTAELAPSIVNVIPVGGLPNTYDVVVAARITPGAWTTLTMHVLRSDGLPTTGFDDRITIGFLPGDVNGDGTSAPVDILNLIDDLNRVRVPPLREWQCDIDRSELCAPADILREIDLLNGVHTSRPWNGATLPARP